MPKVDVQIIAPEVFGTDDPCGPGERLNLGDAGGLTQFGVAIETLRPGSRSSERHWHEAQDEFLMMLGGEAVLVEEGGETTLRAGDFAAWQAGVANAHRLINRSDRDIRFLVVGMRTASDVVHYPDLGRRKETHSDGTSTTYLDDEHVLPKQGDI